MITKTGIAAAAANLEKSYCTGHGRSQKNTKVLHGVSVTIGLHEMVVVVGPSGSGKSTLLYCMSGLETASAGSIELMGKHITGVSRNALSKIRRDHLGFIFQSYNLIPALSVGENVSLPARLAGRSVSAREVASILKRVGLADRLRDRPQDLSSGQQQRVAIARVLACKPDIVFADEPTGALDSRNGTEVLKMLRQIADEPDRSVVMVTHDLEAASLADRIFVLRDGRITRELGKSTATEIFNAMEER